ncbi:tetratricopeptide repeat protein [bacterium]|nr:tetratricopeptide repeat protein [bacterium]
MIKKISLLLFFAALISGCSTSRYELAERYTADRQYEKAVREYLQLINPHVKNGKRYIFYDKEVVTRLGIVYWNMKKFDTAAKIFNRVIEKDPFYGKALFYLGLSYESLGDEEKAIAAYKKFTGIESNDPYRKVLVARLDWLIKLKISREVQMALSQERELARKKMPKNVIAVMYFLNLSDDPEWTPLQRGLAEMIVTDLSQVKQLKVVERLRLSKLLEELHLTASALGQEKNGVRLSRLMGAGTIIKGSYFVKPGMKINFTTGIYDNSTKKEVPGIEYEGSMSRLFRMEKELVLRIVDHFGIKLTPVEREKILKIPTEDMFAFLKYCNGLDALDRGDVSTAQRYFSEAYRHDRTFTEAKDKLMVPEIWNAAHNRNAVRVSNEVASLIRTKIGGKSKMVYRPSPKLVSSWNRLRTIAGYQNVLFLPDNESRKAMQEAETRGASIFPEDLGSPPAPPGIK